MASRGGTDARLDAVGAWPLLAHVRAAAWLAVDHDGAGVRRIDIGGQCCLELGCIEAAGSVIIEQIFAWPGMGRLGYEAILARDFPVILTLNFIAAVLTLAGTFVSDVLYAVVDPRIRVS